MSAEICLVCAQPATTNRTFDYHGLRSTRHFCRIHADAFDLRTRGGPERSFYNELVRMINTYKRDMKEASAHEA